VSPPALVTPGEAGAAGAHVVRSPRVEVGVSPSVLLSTGRSREGGPTGSEAKVSLALAAEKEGGQG